MTHPGLCHDFLKVVTTNEFPKEFPDIYLSNYSTGGAIIEFLRILGIKFDIC